jgi:type II secretory pathway pseudopilin PulG
MAEVLLVLALVAVVLGLTAPAVGSVRDAGRLRQAAGYLGSKIRWARQQAASTGVHTAVVFDRVAGAWTFRLCHDGNGNGVRRAELASGTDPCGRTVEQLPSLFPGVDIGVDAGLRGPSGEPGSADAVRLGSADLMSCSPAGSCTSGTVFIRSVRGAHSAVRIAGVTGRTRILRHDRTGWREP